VNETGLKAYSIRQPTITQQQAFIKTTRATKPRRLIDTRRLLEHWPRALCYAFINIICFIVPVHVNITLHVNSQPFSLSTWLAKKNKSVYCVSCQRSAQKLPQT